MTCDLRQIIKEERIEILMQLIISPNRDFTAGVEALSRGVDEDGDRISPLTLFQQAEEDGLLVELDRLLIQKSLESFRGIPDRDADLLLFINLSDSFIQSAVEGSWLKDLVEKMGMRCSEIVFDINPQTDAAMEVACRFIDRHREMGFYICVDDIGVGMHNIDKVLYLNPDIIKVNVAQVRKLSNRNYRKNLIRFMKQIADQQGILLVAKGLEDEEDVRATLENGAQYMQGYYVSKPVNLETVSLGGIISNYRETMQAYSWEAGEEAELTRAMTARAIGISREICAGIRESADIQQDVRRVFEKYPFIENVWFLNRNGLQSGATVINSGHFTAKSSPMFQIYNDQSDFSGKELYRQLVDTILDVWVTKPYRSVLTNNVVIGCSMYVQEGVEDVILCVNYNHIGLLGHLSSK